MTAIYGLRARRASLSAAVLCAAALAGCAADGSLIETASIAPATPQITASVDPQCAPLAQQIEQLKLDGTVGRLEKVAEGKGSTAVVKRNALQRQAQLNKANADYIAKCGPNAGRTAANSAPASSVVTASAQPGASGVTVVPPKTMTAPAAPKQ